MKIHNIFLYVSYNLFIVDFTSSTNKEVIMANNDFVDSVKAFAKTVSSRKDSCSTEEATKMALIVPLFSLLGYDVYDPNEFCSEYIADVGTKKGEKVDYAILINKVPHILIECKACNENLDDHGSQLFRYFGTSEAKFGILTNGIIYRFFTDLEDANKMDLTPFLEIDMLNLKDAAINNLKKFTKDTYNKDEIFSAAEELKYSKQIKDKLQSLMEDPDDDFTKLIMGYVYDKVKTQKMIDKFKPLIKKSFNTYVSDTVNSRISSALQEVKEKEKEAVPDEPESNDDTGIITTDEEMEAFFIVRAILAEKVPVTEIQYKDTKSYFGINYQGKVQKAICRLNLEGKKKYISIPDEEKNFPSIQIESVDSIYTFRNELLSVLDRYLHN